MITRKLIYYIKNGLERGLSLNEIKTALLSAGWAENDIDNAASIALGKKKQAPVVYEEKGKKPGKVLFVALIVIIFLGAVAGYFFVYGIGDFSFENINSFQNSELQEKKILFEETVGAETIDCGNNITCYNELAINCKPCRLVFNQDEIISYFEIKGVTDGLCLWQLRAILSQNSEDDKEIIINCRVYPDELTMEEQFGIIIPYSMSQLGDRCEQIQNGL